LFIVEDLQHLGGPGVGRRAAAVESLVQVFEHLLARQRQMVFSASVGPGELVEISARLRSRLASGLVVGLLPLRASSRVLLLQEMAQRRQLAVSKEVLNWLAERLIGGGRQLEGAIVQLETLARLQSVPLDLAKVVSHFQDQTHLRRPTVERIAQHVGIYFRVEPRHLQSRSRYHNVLVPRQVGMYLARRLTGLSLEQIGAYF